jgi:hypothetical protein
MADYKGDYDDLFTFLEGTQPGSGKDPDASKSVTNDPFGLYPNKSRTVRLNNATDQLEAHTQVLPKGFIRNLVTNQGGNLAQFPNIRCNFQFNPQDIQHQIEARKDMYLPILQDPSQLNQPMAGNATFAFELIFDRSMEVNSNRSLTVTNDEGTMPDPKSPETVGVFHDLRVLYSIIGQGLSSELMEAQLAKLKQDVKNYATVNYKQLNIQATATAGNPVTTFQPLNTDGGVYAEDGDADYDLNSKKTADFLTNIDSDPSGGIKFMSDLNVGNSAFLIPQPCRVIFSPMFMVDGFVMNTNVLFTKFSAKMIPIQCKVYLQMQAIYIGFARAKTFITAQIEETQEQNDEELTTYTNNLTTLRKLLETHLQRITVAYNADPRILSDGGIPDATLEYSQSITSTKSGANSESFGLIYQPFWMFATKNFWYNRPYAITGGTSLISEAKPQSTSNDPYAIYEPTVLLKFANPELIPCLTPYGVPGITVELSQTVDDRKAIRKKVFEDMSSDNPVVDIKVFSYIYGPFNSETDARAFTATIPSDRKSKVPTGRVGEYTTGYAFRDTDGWDDFTKKPKNWTLGTSTFDPVYNGLNKGSQAINISTANSSGSNIKTRLDQLLETLDYPETDSDQARKLYIETSSVDKEISDPSWDASKVSSNSANGYNAVPFDVYQKLPNSLLDLVDDVHDLSNKYFAVVTVVAVYYNIAAPGNEAGGSALDRSVIIVKGDNTRFKDTLSPIYSVVA